MTYHTQSLGILSGFACLVGLLLYATGSDGKVIVASVALILGLQPRLETVLAERNRTKNELFRRNLAREYAYGPITLVLLVSCYFILATRVTDWVISQIAGNAARFVLDKAIFEKALLMDDHSREVAVFTAIGFVAAHNLVPASAIYIVPISKWAVHFSRVRALPLIFAGVVVAVTIDSIFAVAVRPPLQAWAGAEGVPNLPLTVVLPMAWQSTLFVVPGILIGWFLARRTHDAWVLRRMLQSLSPEDQSALLDLTVAKVGDGSKA